MDNFRCPTCMFCVEITEEHIRCSNADLAQDSAWEQIYLTQGFLDIPHPRDNESPCFWFVHAH